MTAPLVASSRTSADLAREIAHEIRTNGHFRGTNTERTVGDNRVKVCIVSNNCFYGEGTSPDARIGLIESIIKIASINTEAAEFDRRRQVVVEWNDHSETEHVLEVLDKISALG